MRMAAMTFRRAAPADTAGLTALQHAAYAPNAAILGVTPLPLLVDYADIVADMEVTLAICEGSFAGALIVHPQSDHLLIWSVATAPEHQGAGLGNRFLDMAQARAATLGLFEMRLYTGSRLIDRVAWYARKGFVTTHEEVLSDRVITHMSRPIA
jgi:N-acetylglutamate synthase-like GNAT family acetyltransferase